MRYVVALALLAGCSSAELAPPPTAGAQQCAPTPRVFCDAGAPGPTSCTADPSAPGNVKLLPTASYPVGCHAVVLSSDCNNVQVSCSCDASDGGAAAWTCSPP